MPDLHLICPFYTYKKLLSTVKRRIIMKTWQNKLFLIFVEAFEGSGMIYNTSEVNYPFGAA